MQTWPRTLLFRGKWQPPCHALITPSKQRACIGRSPAAWVPADGSTLASSICHCSATVHGAHYWSAARLLVQDFMSDWFILVSARQPPNFWTICDLEGTHRTESCAQLCKSSWVSGRSIHWRWAAKRGLWIMIWAEESCILACNGSEWILFSWLCLAKFVNFKDFYPTNILASTIVVLTMINEFRFDLILQASSPLHYVFIGVGLPSQFTVRYHPNSTCTDALLPWSLPPPRGRWKSFRQMNFNFLFLIIR